MALLRRNEKRSFSSLIGLVTSTPSAASAFTTSK
jgi:hypothetical protein